MEELCQRIVMISGGESRFDGSTAALHAQVGIPTALQVKFHHPIDPTRLLVTGVSCTAEQDGRQVIAQFNRAQVSAVDVLGALSQAGEIADFSLQEPSLEAVMERVYRGDREGHR